MSFANCALPYYIGEIVNERDNVLAYTPETFIRKSKLKSKHIMKL